MRFWYTLALAQGRSVAETQAATSSREFAHWQAYHAISPIGPERLDILIANLCAVIANRHRDAKRERPYRVRDFLVDWWGRPAGRQQTTEHMKAIVLGFMQAQNAAASRG